MSSSDPIEKFIPEMIALLRRVWGAGGDAAIARVVAAARVDEAMAPSPRPEQAPPLPAEPIPMSIALSEPPPRRERKHPYGVVTRTVTDLLRQSPNGLTRQQIRQAAQSKGIDIDEETAKNTLKVLLRRDAAHSRDGAYFLGPNPTRETGAATAPASSSTH